MWPQSTVVLYQSHKYQGLCRMQRRNVLVCQLHVINTKDIEAINAYEPTKMYCSRLQTMEVVLIGAEAFAKLTRNRAQTVITNMLFVIFVTAVRGYGWLPEQGH